MYPNVDFCKNCENAGLQDILFLETSALTGENVQETWRLFFSIILIQSKKIGKKTAFQHSSTKFVQCPQDNAQLQ